MRKQLKDYLSKTKGFSNSFKKHFDNKEVITNILSEIIITLGVVLIVGGLYLMILVPGSINQTAQTTAAPAQSVINSTVWIPGLPFLIQDLHSCSITTIGLVSWLMGVNLLLTGLGLWIRHKFARLAALTIFFLATGAQSIQFLLMGIIGSPNSIVLLAIDATISYLLLAKVDSQKIERKPIRPNSFLSALPKK